MPEEAPVMRTTLPATFSWKTKVKKERKHLRAWYGGNKNRRVKKVKGGAIRFKNMLIRSMAVGR